VRCARQLLIALNRSWSGRQERKNLNTTFFSLRSINNDGQIRRSRFARSTVSSKTFERAHKPVGAGSSEPEARATEQASQSGYGQSAMPGL